MWAELNTKLENKQCQCDVTTSKVSCSVTNDSIDIKHLWKNLLEMGKRITLPMNDLNFVLIGTKSVSY